MDIYFCSTCGARYIPGESNYCVKCGAVIRVRDVSQDIKFIQREPKPYETLRIVSGFIILFGWITVIVGWMVAFAIGAWYGETLAQLVSDAAPYSVARNQSFLVSVIIGFMFTIQGFGMIASGQVYMALLDIRNDTHTTMRLITRLGLAMLDTKNEPPAPSP